MPKAPPQNLSRSFNTRWTGIFKKAAELHRIDESVRISIIVEKPRVTPLVFSTEERSHNWPQHIQDYVQSRGPIVKRPSHYLSLSDGISQGRVRIVRASSDSPSPPPQLPPPPPYMLGRASTKTPDVLAMEDGDDMQESPPSYYSGEGYSLPATPPRMMTSRVASPLPVNPILPSKLQNS